ALSAKLEVLIPFLVQKHRCAFLAFRPEAFRDIALFGFGRTDLRVLVESGFSAGGWRSDGGLGRFQAKGLFGEGRGGHIQAKRWGLCFELILRQSNSATEGGDFGNREAVDGQSKNRHA